MFITKKALARRTFLRGMGVTMALPLLDAMVPAASAPSVGVVPSASGASSVCETPLQASLPAPWCTTRSPPSTRRPRKVRSMRTWVAPSGSTTVSVTSTACPVLARAARGWARSASTAAAATRASSPRSALLRPVIVVVGAVGAAWLVAAVAVATPRLPTASTAAVASPMVVFIRFPLSRDASERASRHRPCPTTGAGGTRWPPQLLALQEGEAAPLRRRGRAGARGRP